MSLGLDNVVVQYYITSCNLVYRRLKLTTQVKIKICKYFYMFASSWQSTSRKKEKEPKRKKNNKNTYNL
jgi:hypothetical protein